LELHLVVDDVSLDTVPALARWLGHDKRARWYLHCTPAGAPLSMWAAAALGSATMIPSSTSPEGPPSSSSGGARPDAGRPAAPPRSLSQTGERNRGSYCQPGRETGAGQPVCLPEMKGKPRLVSPEGHALLAWWHRAG
jgi:hypothetical protein